MTSQRETRRDDEAEGDARIAAAMFSPQGRSDPRYAWQQAEVAGARYAVARDMLRDPSFTAGAPGQATEPMWRMFRRWLVRLDDDRRRRMRARLTGIFAPRRVEAYRATIVSRGDALLDRLFDDLARRGYRPEPERRRDEQEQDLRSVVGVAVATRVKDVVGKEGADGDRQQRDLAEQDREVAAVAASSRA